jgi:hypothetical protein
MWLSGSGTVLFGSHVETEILPGCVECCKYRRKYTTRQAMYVLRNTEALLCNHCCCGKSIIITYSECVFVDLGVQHEMRMRHILICSLPDDIFPHCLIKGTIFEKKVTEHKMCALVSSTSSV